MAINQATIQNLSQMLVALQAQNEELNRKLLDQNGAWRNNEELLQLQEQLLQMQDELSMKEQQLLEQEVALSAKQEELAKKEGELREYETRVKNEGKKFKLMCKEVARMEQQAKRERKRSVMSQEKEERAPDDVTDHLNQQIRQEELARNVDHCQGQVNTFQAIQESINVAYRS